MSDESILLRLEAQGKRAPRVLLKQNGSPGAPPIDACGRYEILGALAQGGVGEVLRGRDTDLGRDVAIKVLRAGHVANPEMLQRFVDEAQIAGQLQHPGVVPVYELGLRADRRPYIAMKLVKGRTLAAILKEDPSDRRRLLHTFEQVCRTVAYAHGRGVVHRDLKPSNLMVGAFGEVQILDWGFAKVLARGGVADERPRRDPDVTRIATVRSGGGSESVAGSVMGTPAYMPPEQALGHVDELDERSDVFSLGAILCEILTGKPPYTGDDPLAKAAQARLDDAHARLDACEADRELVELARRCLSPMRADRPRDAGDVAEGVGGHLAAVEERAHAAAVAAAEAEEATERARMETREQRRARRQTILLAGAVLLAAAAGAGSYLAVVADRRERSEAVNVAILEAQRLRGEGAWAAARAAAEKAAALARAGEVAPDLRDRADESLAAIAAEEEAARRDAEHRALATAFVADLDEIRLEATDAMNHEDTDDRFKEVFARHGVDLDSPDAAERIARDWSGVREPLAAALDQRAWQRRVALGDWQRLVTIAKAIDRDPWRDRLRDAVAERDPGALRELRREAADHDDLSVRTLYLLALGLEAAGEREEAIALLREQWNRHADDFCVNLQLGTWLRQQKRPEESIRYARAAVALRAQSAFAWHELGHILADRDDLAGAESALRKAWDLAPQVLTHPSCLAWLLQKHKEPERAKQVGEDLRRRIAPDSADEWFKLGCSLGRAWLVDAAIEAYREAIRLRPDDVLAYGNLGVNLMRRGDNTGAIDAYRTALRLRPDHGLTHGNLGGVLLMRGDLEAAETAYRDAIRFGLRDARIHNNLGVILDLKGDVDAALAEFREAARMEATLPQPRKNIGLKLYYAGDRAGALESFRKAKELGLGEDEDTWIARTERTIELERQLPEILEARVEPADAAERATCAWLCHERRLYVESAHLYADALKEELSFDARFHRHNAACSAIQAGTEEWRSRALAWLRTDLASWDAWDERACVRRWELDRWKRDADLAPVRDRIDELPEAEREEWRKLWADVDALLALAPDATGEPGRPLDEAEGR